ncbi:hypothetical protein [Mycobacterium conspicuum]|jgi:hypothetical protein|uniref:Uncharacterized protein n=1 Tax=Mycobacterium conspicuum TaxID=44010 RepID=A0A1X1SZE5_9MYCO|nr:hypothetical protein [Mycobacterium conspicuum]ORV37255.1 hypothetical protein AWC00_23100 [Mycobacterium conspicuum]BBZ38731.1 hypothetical protein MCNS_17940 [Mycobacterium conspicuum]CNI32483.1 Uncharacterised protein [Mycobacterium tuberculosis]
MSPSDPSEEQALRQAGSTALELIELCRLADESEHVSLDTVTRTDWPTVAAGMVYLIQSTALVVGNGDMRAGLAAIRNIVIGGLAQPSEDS